VNDLGKKAQQVLIVLTRGANDFSTK